MKNKKLREQVKSYIIVTLACVLYALSFDWFYAPNGFTVGGFTGISQIINFFAPILPVGCRAERRADGHRAQCAAFYRGT